jgi:hypothetical protein
MQLHHQNRCLPRPTQRLSMARAWLHNVAILHEVSECFIVVKLGCTVEICFMLVCFNERIARAFNDYRRVAGWQGVGVLVEGGQVV